jgi:hypothetical protein
MTEPSSGWQFGIHLRTKLLRRSIPVEWLMATLDNPDRELASGRRRVYQKRFGDQLLRVAVEGRLVVTAYLTSRVEKYSKEG